MPLINLSGVVLRRSMAQNEPIQVKRYSARTEAGRIVKVEDLIEIKGTIVPANTKDIIMGPNGDAITGQITIYTTSKLYTTVTKKEVFGKAYVSDQVIWHEDEWKVFQVADYSDYGYFKAVCIRMATA